MISFIKSALKNEDFLNDKKEVVFVGRSNAGKSTLINTLYKKGLAFTGKTPGKTRMINYFNIDGFYYAVDVPGYGFANRSQQEAIDFGEMMEAYFSRKNIALCVMIVDSRLGLTKDDVQMIEFLKEKKIHYLLIANKIDKLSNNQLNNNKQKFFSECKNIIYVSCEKRLNLDQVKEKIMQAL